MSAHIPPAVAESWEREYLTSNGVKLLGQGKVRDMYEYPERSDLLLMVTTDRASIFDLVLPRFVPKKGEVLTALTHFWLTTILKDFPHHLEPSKTNPRLNASHDLKKKFPKLPLERCLVVKKTEIPPYEMIFRHHLGGSIYAEYLKNGLVAGLAVPSGYPKWAKLAYPLFTPSTKEEKGHDKNITEKEYLEAVGRRGFEAIQMFGSAYSNAYDYAERRGILILDTKCEGLSMIADEVLTPDSSRYTTVADFNRATEEGRDPIFFDKQFLRDWGMTVETPFGMGLNSLRNPEDPEQLAFVSKVQIPDEVIEVTVNRYSSIFGMLVDYSLEVYQATYMGV